MELVRTTKVIDELLVRAVDKGLSNRLLNDYKQTGVVDFAIDVMVPMHQAREVARGLLCGQHMLDEKGNPLDEPVTDSDDRKYWVDTIREVRDRWVNLKGYFAELDKLSLSQIQKQLELPSRHAARAASEGISHRLLHASIVVESLDIAEALVGRDWRPEDSCREVQFRAIDWLVEKLDLLPSVASKAKKGKLMLGLAPSEHYSHGLYGRYLPDSTIRVRCELCYPHPLEAVITRRYTIVHEAVHAVTAVQTGQDKPNGDWAFWEGLAEFCSLRYFEEQLSEHEDWLFWPLSEYHEEIAHPRYLEAYRRVESLFALTGDYRILSALLRMKRFTVEDEAICMTHCMGRIERLVQVLGFEIASELIRRILDKVATESVGKILYLAGDKPKEDLLVLHMRFDETFPSLVELADADC